MDRLILTFMMTLSVIGVSINAQSSFYPNWNSKLLEWKIIDNIVTVPVDTLDPEKAEWLAKQEAKAQRKLKKKEEKRINNAHRNMNADRTSVSHGNTKLALSLFENQAYSAALEIFKTLSAEDKSSTNIMSKMAKAYQMNAQYEASEYWYGRLVKSSMEYKYLLEYAKVLQANNKCEDAVYYYQQYAEKSGDSTPSEQELMESCLNANNFAHYDQIEIFNAESLNSEYLDFAPIPVGNGVVFTSSRESDRFQVNKDCWTKENYTDLFYAEANGCNFENIETLDGAVNGRFHDGAASFGAGGEVMFFTRNNYRGKSKNGLIDLKIWQSTKKDGLWQQAEELPFNSDEYTTSHPTLSEDGQRLYFSSNRPGGQGGMDIWVAQFVDGTWQEPMNLGAEINSSGNELFPFIDQDENLYYSSNGFPGKGGLDLFKAAKKLKSDEESWTARQNMGTPFNSTADDFGFYIRPDEEGGFLTSNRKGGKGGDDIYCWQGKMSAPAIEAPVFVNTNFCVSDQENGSIVSNAKVNINKISNNSNEQNLLNGEMVVILKPMGDGQYTLGVNNPQAKGGEDINKSFSTSKSGGFEFPIDRNAEYNVAINKKGYETLNATYSGEELILIDGCMSIKKENCYAIKGKINFNEAGTSKSSVKMKILDRTTNTNLEIPVDENGNYETCLPCGHDFRINGRVDGFDSDFRNFNSMGEDCGNGATDISMINLRKRKIVSVDTYVEAATPAPTPIPSANYNYANPCYTCIPVNPCYTCQPVAMNAPVTRSSTVKREAAVVAESFEYSNLRKGAVISLDDVYYDYNKSNIRNDASESLDKLLQIMSENSDMVVQMQSHTDSRGNANYNNWLSRERAKAARAYLISRGINCDRITIRGFGERRLLNDCGDGVNCDEATHQLNRRTEFEIIRN